MASDAWGKVLAAIRRLNEKVDSMKIGISYATVLRGSPLQIRFDGMDKAEDGAPFTIARVAAGDRVHVLRWGTNALVLGRAGGADPNIIVVNGVGYERSGTFVKTVQANQWDTRSGVHIHQADVTLPVQPPGWVYVFNCVGSSPALWPTIQVAARNNNVITYTIRIQRFAVPDFAVAFRASWELIKDTAG